jgi:hypothetical protein
MYETQVIVPVDYLSCKICEKTYNKLGSHAICYKKFCWICIIKFNTAKEQENHSKLHHPDFFCNSCKECISNITNHKKNKKFCIP